MNDAATPPLPGYTIYDPVDPFENGAGPFWYSQTDGAPPNFAVRVTAQHCNSHGIVHGGLMMTMIASA